MPGWSNLFTHAEPNPPLDPDLRDAVSGSVTALLDAGEIERVTAEGGSGDGWQFPARPLPASYLDFLGWSNGGFFLAGEREFQMLAAEELRVYLIEYRVPYFLPHAVPFALDGNGHFYAFDLREPADAAGEHPVLFVDTGHLDAAAAVVVAGSFRDLLTDRTDPAGRLPS
jgi:hypothetical protein